MINHYAIAKVGKLCLASISGDDQLRLWMDCWVGIGLVSMSVLLLFYLYEKTVVLNFPLYPGLDEELVKSEASFSVTCAFWWSHGTLAVLILIS